MVGRVEESLVQHAGVTAQQQAPSRPRGRVEVRSSVLEGGPLRRLHTVGTDTLIDGIAVSHAASTAFATVRSSRVEGNGRAGLSNWGATISVQGSAFFCNPIQLNGELDLGSDFAYADLGGNVCGCDGPLETCQVQSSQLEPPKGVVDPQL
jgi:hypothetical protein